MNDFKKAIPDSWKVCERCNEPHFIFKESKYCLPCGKKVDEEEKLKPTAEK